MGWVTRAWYDHKPDINERPTLFFSPPSLSHAHTSIQPHTATLPAAGGRKPAGGHHRGPLHGGAGGGGGHDPVSLSVKSVLLLSTRQSTRSQSPPFPLELSVTTTPNNNRKTNPSPRLTHTLPPPLKDLTPHPHPHPKNKSTQSIQGRPPHFKAHRRWRALPRLVLRPERHVPHPVGPEPH